MKERRLGNRLRILADEAWARGNKDLSTDLHEAARKAEKIRDIFKPS